LGIKDGEQIAILAGQGSMEMRSGSGNGPTRAGISNKKNLFKSQIVFCD